MPKNKPPKVAYTVFVGRNPGVYSTWFEAEKEVKGFSHSCFKGYTTEGGGYAEAEREFREHVRKQALEGETISSAYRDIDGLTDTVTRSSEKPVRPQVSDYVTQSTTPHRHIAQQLQTPPDTLMRTKRERPTSWEADHDLCTEAKSVVDDGTPEASTGLEQEHTHFHIASHTARSAKLLICHADDCSIDDSSSASQAPVSTICSDMVAIDPSFANESSSSGDFGSTSFVKVGTLGATADEAALSRQALLATDSEDTSGTSTMVFDGCSNENSSTNTEIYPRLPVFRDRDHADISGSPSNNRSHATDLNAVSDKTSLAPDYIPLGTSSDYGDLIDDPAVLDRIIPNGPRIEPCLCDEQLALVGTILRGRNVFYTGSAGCGKSTVLKHFIPLLRKEGKKVDVLAPTGRAALEVNGRTLHSYAGWVPHSLNHPLGKLEHNARGKKVRKRLIATDVLIIDEISMVANHVFERLDCIMKAARGSEKPFGGVQVIVTGDFCQLPPVKAFEYCLMCGTTLEPVFWEGKYECNKCFEQYLEIDKWAFCSAAWKRSNFEHVNLEIVHRQKDADFKAILEKYRFGRRLNHDEILLLLEHESETKDAVRLFPRRVDVKAINQTELAKLPGRPLTYLCLDNFSWNQEHENLSDKGDRCPEPMNHALEALREHSFEPKIVLKEGMLVILLINWDLSSSLANGSQGTIIGFEKHDPKLFPEVPRDWDYSGRKNGLVNLFVKRAAVQEWPIVKFLNGTTRTIYPRCVINELGDDAPYSLLSRTQIPLMAAWAMTVHKAQGMTLSRVIVDLRHSFEPGQVYVALSRAENLGGLKVEGLPREDRGLNKQVIEFLEKNNLMQSIRSDECSEEKSSQVNEDIK